MKWLRKDREVRALYDELLSCYRRILSHVPNQDIFNNERASSRPIVLEIFIDIQHFVGLSKRYIRAVESLGILSHTWYLSGPGGFARATQFVRMCSTVEILLDHVRLFAKTDLPEYGITYYYDQYYDRGYRLLVRT